MASVGLEDILKMREGGTKMLSLLLAPVLTVTLPLVYGYNETRRYHSLTSGCLLFLIVGCFCN